MTFANYSPKQVQWFLGAAALLLVIFYLAVFRPLSTNAESLEKPLHELSKKLAAEGGSNAATARLDFHGISNSLQQVESALAHLQQNSSTAFSRVQQNPEIQTRLSEPFRLIDYFHERQRRVDQLLQLSRESKAQLDPAVLSGLPDYRMELADSSLLWAQLSLAERLLRCAMLSGVSVIRRTEVHPARLSSQGQFQESLLDEISIRLELTGPMDAVSRFLSGLPLQEEEREQYGWPFAGGEGPALYIERLILRKTSPEKPDEVHLDLVATGFVQRRQIRHTAGNF
jgi:hypothetical protein